MLCRLTPRITRRPEPFQEDDNLPVGGRVQALVGRRPELGATQSAQPPQLVNGAADRGTKSRAARYPQPFSFVRTRHLNP